MLKSNRFILGIGLIILLFIAAIITTFSGLNFTVDMLEQLASKDIEILALAKDIQFQDLTLTDAIRGLIINPSSRQDLDIYDAYHYKINDSIKKMKQIEPDSIETFNTIDNLNARLFELESLMISKAKTSPEESIAIYKGEYSLLRTQLQNILEDFVDGKKQYIIDHAKNDAQKSSELRRHAIVVGLITATISIIIGMLLISERKSWEKQAKKYQKNLRSLGAQLSKVQENERRLISTEIHDYIGQSLSVVKIKLGMLGESMTSTEDKANIQQIRDFVNQAIKYIQGLTFKLNLPTHYDIEFTEALKWICQQFQKDHGLPIKVENELYNKPINKNARIILLRAVRELLNNVVKHSNAQQVLVKVKNNKKNIIIVVKDDGVGMDISQLEDFYFNENGRFGLFSISEGLQHLGGSMKIDSKPNSGTAITMEVPLEPVPSEVLL